MEEIRINSNKESDWMYSHAMIPVAEHLYDDIFFS